MRNARSNLQFIDDLAKVATGALGSFGDIRQQVRKQAKDRVEQVLSKMDLVTREEFERVEAVAEKARERQEQLEKRLAALEKSSGEKSSGAKARTAKAKAPKGKKK